MKLNPDCVRDILLLIEDKIQYPGDEIVFDQEIPFNELSSYQWHEIRYHLSQCAQYGFIDVNAWYMDSSVSVSDLTPAGHEFLADIRSNTNWAKTKEISHKVGSASLRVIAQIAAGVVTRIINNQI